MADKVRYSESGTRFHVCSMQDWFPSDYPDKLKEKHKTLRRMGYDPLEASHLIQQDLRSEKSQKLRNLPPCVYRRNDGSYLFCKTVNNERFQKVFKTKKEVMDNYKHLIEEAQL